MASRAALGIAVFAAIFSRVYRHSQIRFSRTPVKPGCRSNRRVLTFQPGYIRLPWPRGQGKADRLRQVLGQHLQQFVRLFARQPAYTTLGHRTEARRTAAANPSLVHDDWNLALVPSTLALITVGGMRDGDFTGKVVLHGRFRFRGLTLCIEGILGGWNPMIENFQALDGAVLRVLDDWSTALREKDKDIPEAAYSLKRPAIGIQHPALQIRYLAGRRAVSPVHPHQIVVLVDRDTVRIEKGPRG